MISSGFVPPVDLSSSVRKTKDLWELYPPQAVGSLFEALPPSSFETTHRRGSLKTYCFGLAVPDNGLLVVLEVKKLETI